MTSVPRYSIATVSRVIKIELPYLWSFIRHYRSLGVNRIYLQSTNRSDYVEIRDYLIAGDEDIFVSLVTLIDEDIPTAELSQCINRVAIEEDYVINIDIDEFIEIDVPNLHALLSTRPAEYYNFNWIMVPNDDYRNPGDCDMRRGFDGHTGKFMVRKALARRINGHFPMLTDSGIAPVQAGRLVHYWGRSFKDTVFKCCYQRLGDSKSSSLQEVNRIVQTGILPKRLKLLALLCRKQRTVPLQDNYINVDAKCEEMLELQFELGASLDAIHRIYEGYKSLVTTQLMDQYPRIPLIQLARFL